jgi:isopenicillin-N N-acyltransferase-like protein
VIRHYRSAPAAPRDRGRDFGAAYPAEIRATAEIYSELFAATAGRPVELRTAGREALAAIRAFSAAAASEIEGIAEGAGLPAEVVAAVNARTEILAAVRAARPGGVGPGRRPPETAARAASASRGECSTVVRLGGPGNAPIALQTWDWHDVFAGSWLVWTIEHPDGHVVHTLTEYGILGKIGVSSADLGLNLNILHHGHDGGPVGVPVHVLARSVLDSARDIGQALTVIGTAAVSASSAFTLTSAGAGEPIAITAEVFPGGPRFVPPRPDGLLLHTNHFLDPHAAEHEQETWIGPDSFLRLAILERRLARRAAADEPDLLAAMSSHLGGGGAICCHPDAAATLGERYATLATVVLDVQAGALRVRAGGPCEQDSPWWNTRDLAVPLSVKGT